MLTFSNKRKYSGNFSFSPDSNFFAISKGVQVVVYSTQILKPIKIYTFIDFIEDLKWSNNSQLLLIGIYKRNRCEIRNIQNDNYLCTIDDGIQGMSYALFSPDSLYVLSINENITKLSIRSLQSKSLLFISLPKFSKKGISFSSQGRGNFMALAERKETKDIIGIYYTLKWACIRRFETEAEDLQDIKWSYDNSSIIIIDTPAVCKILIYNLLGELINKIEVYQNKLGIKKFEMSHDGHLFCLGLYDQTLRIYNNISYTCMSIFEHDKEILNDNKINYFKEEIINEEGETKYIELNPPVNLSNENTYIKGKNLFNDKMPKIGISKISISFSNYYLASKNENMPNVLFIWNLNTMSLQTVLIHLNEIQCFKWHKNKDILFICTNNNKLYYYTLDSCKILQLVDDFYCKSLIFSEDGKTMIVKDTNNFILVNIGSETVNEMNPNIQEIQDEEHFQGEEQEIPNDEEGQYEKEIIQGEEEQYDEGQGRYEEDQGQYEEGQRQYLEGQRQYEEGEGHYEEGQGQYAEEQEQYEQGQ